VRLRDTSRQAPALLLAAIAGTAACRAPLPAPERDWRAARNQAVRRELLAAGRTGIPGLRFYPFDPAYRVRGMIVPAIPPQPLRLPTSSGAIRPAHRVGRITLRLPPGDATLALYSLDDLETVQPGHLFLPFRDAGAGTETYGAGRYVEVALAPGGVVEVDFNRAYNPDCAYGITAQCPIAPSENTVPFAVAAGEMMPAAHE
jgi:uncharacterized protein